MSKKIQWNGALQQEGLVVLSQLGGLIVSPTKVGYILIAADLHGLKRKFDLDIGNLDFHRHTGYLNAIIYPADAEIRPRLISGLLKGRGGFEVNRYKTITFHSNHINWTNDNRATSFTGILSAKNRSIPVTFQRRKFDCKAEAGGHRTCKAHFHAEVDRTKLDLNQGTSFGMSKQAPIELTFTMRD